MPNRTAGSIVARPVGVQVDLELTLAGPLLVVASESGPWGTDAVCLRDPHGRLVIPGTLLKGLYRESLESLGIDPWGHDIAESSVYSRSEDKGADSQLDKNLARKVEESRTARPLNTLRFPIDFSDFRAMSSTPAAGQQIITMTEVNDDTGVVQSGSLRSFDCPVLHGETCRFRGTVTGLCESSDYDSIAFEFAERVRNVFYWKKDNIGEAAQIPAIGQNKSTGFGEVLGAKVIQIQLFRLVPSHSSSQSVAADGQPEQSDETGEPISQTATEIDVSQVVPAKPVRPISYNGPFDEACEFIRNDIGRPSRKFADYPIVFDVEWEVLDPFCISERAIKGNIFESTDVVGGDILKGSIARLIKEANGIRGDIRDAVEIPLCKLFGSLQFSTAAPTGLTVTPHSVVVTSNSVFDIALMNQSPTESLILNREVPRFFRDWKHSDRKRVAAHYPDDRPKRQLRVRTAIETSTRQAKDQQLFATRVVVPTDETWNGQIIWQQSPQSKYIDEWEEAMTSLLDLLDSKLMVIGKTGARVRGRITGWKSFSAIDDEIENIYSGMSSADSLYTVVLQTPALLLDWWNLVDEKGIPKTDSALQSAYQSTFQELSEKHFDLQQFYASHELVGGHRAWSIPRNDADGAYNPILLTSAGSTFVLKKRPDDHEACRRILRRWNYRGLQPEHGPLTAAATNTYGTDINNRYVPLNGYGAVMLNDPRHRELMPVQSKVREQ